MSEIINQKLKMKWLINVLIIKIVIHKLVSSWQFHNYM